MTQLQPARLISSGYFDSAVRDVYRLVTEAKDNLKNHRFDAIACQGVSGLILAPILAWELDVRLIIVRKTLSGSHASSMIEGEVAYGDRILFVDDFTSGYNTYGRVRDQIKALKMKTKPIAGYLYLFGQYRTARDMQKGWRTNEKWRSSTLER